MAFEIFKVAGIIAQADAQAAAFDFNRQVAEQNRSLALQEAKVAEAAQRREARFAAGLNRANLGASGLLAEGSFLDIQADNAVTAEFNALTIRQRGEVEALGFTNEASLLRSAASNARKQGRIAAGTALLSDASRAAGGFG